MDILTTLVQCKMPQLMKQHRDLMASWYKEVQKHVTNECILFVNIYRHLAIPNQILHIFTMVSLAGCCYLLHVTI